MPTSRVDIFIHLVWATWDRQPILTDDLAPRVQHVVAKKAQECGAEVLALGGVADHLHLLVRLPATDYATIMAGGVVASVPVLLLFVATQRFVVEGVSRSGLKG